MTVAEWNALDWLLAIILLLSTTMGYRRGLMRTLLGLAGFVAAFLFASWKYTRVADLITDAGWVASTATARVLAYLLIVAFVSAGVELIARLLQKTIRAAGLGFADRTFGAALGFLRGFMLGFALLMIPTTFAPQSRLIATSALSPYFFAAAHDVSFLVP